MTRLKDLASGIALVAVGLFTMQQCTVLGFEEIERGVTMILSAFFGRLRE